MRFHHHIKQFLRAGPSRRRILKTLACGVASLAGWVSAGSLFRARAAAQAFGNSPPLPAVSGNDLVRMQGELQASLSRPLTSRRWAMVIDPRKCIGCNACVISCRAENVTGPEGSYRRVPEAPAGSFPYLSNAFMPINCVQCDDPPCRRAVPPGMITKRPDGIVEFDYAKLTGPFARQAAGACPCRAVHVDRGEFFTSATPAVQAYERRNFVEYQATWNRQNQGLPVNAARKCHFCLHRVEAGLLPACVATCIGGAVYFGDLNDASSLVGVLLRVNRTIRIHEELGIEPRVHYIDEKIRHVSQFSCATCH